MDEHTGAAPYQRLDSTGSQPNTTGTNGMQTSANADTNYKQEEANDETRSSNDAEYRLVPLPKQSGADTLSTDHFCSNVVITSKYTAWSFLPLFMLESFRKLANAYFLLVSVLQCIPIISNTGGVPTNLPVLMFILAVDAVLAIIEDNRRHKADNEANSAECQVLVDTFTNPNGLQKMKPVESDPGVATIPWSQLTVGSIVKLHNRQTAPADLLILAVSEADPSNPTGICYVETKSLDGETNLKLRQACDTTLYAQQVPDASRLNGYLRCENPNKVIGRFDGTLYLNSTAVPDNRDPGKPTTVTDGSSASSSVPHPVSLKNVLLRGCQLRNTDWAYGLVINTGSDTKIMQSMAKPEPKWSSINETVNNMIIWLFVLLCVLCAIATTTQVLWLNANQGDADVYLDWNPDLVSQWFVGFGYYFLLIYQMIPVSLYVTISMVMFFQAFFMTQDLDMYYDELDTRMMVRSMGLNEELGQISYIFSDKTGTLTCNVMEFRKCSIDGVSYGKGTTEIGRAALKRKGIHVPEEETDDKDPMAQTLHHQIPYVNFDDKKLWEKLEKDDQRSKEAEFFLHLGICHTVIPETVEDSGEVRFSASSPDEQALVSGAKFFGFEFESRGLGVARVRVRHKSLLEDKSAESELQEFELLDVLEFTSARKRMSVVAKYPNGEIWLLTKGADNVLYPLLSKENDSDVMKNTMQHLETFGDDGLRTLTVARKQLHEEEYRAWSEKYKEATTSLEEIEKRKNDEENAIDKLMEELEMDLELLGATAIEDKLQKDVPSTIANLMTAGMKVWMLTGDKQETAINISYACQLMDNDMEQIVLNCSLYSTPGQLAKYLEECYEQKQSNSFRQAVVIDGECLEMTLLDDRCRQSFLQLSLLSDAVVCCRVSPSQKAEVVALVRETNAKARTLSIGDGANDVAMIQKAHVGVGICGQEGMQAVNSSDYAIAQFAFLEKLLLHHGRLNYKRMSILTGYMFYKNILMVLAQYWYMFATGSSGQKFYSEFAFQLYNVAYTSLPIIWLGVFDYDVPWQVGKRFPKLYLVGPNMELFNNYTFFRWICSAFFESGVIAIFTMFAFNENWSAWGSAPRIQYGLICFTLVVLVVNAKLALLQMSWQVPGLLLCLFGIICYLPLSILIPSYWVGMFPEDYGVFQNTLLQETYWMVIPIALCVCLLRHWAWTAIQRRFYPQPYQIVQEKYVLSKKRANDVDIEAADLSAIEGNSYLTSSTPVGDGKSERRSDPQRRSNGGYAFSYDAQTTMAESYMSMHTVQSASAAMSNAAHRNPMSREDSRSSNFSESPSSHRSNGHSPIGRQTTGLLV